MLTTMPLMKPAVLLTSGTTLYSLKLHMQGKLVSSLFSGLNRTQIITNNHEIIRALKILDIQTIL